MTRLVRWINGNSERMTEDELVEALAHETYLALMAKRCRHGGPLVLGTGGGVMAATVPALEVAAILRGVIAGRTTVKAIGRTWADVYAGNVEFALSSGATIVLFNDCNELDYVDHIEMADGRSSGYDDWYQGDIDAVEGDPLNLLSPGEQDALLAVLNAAQVAG